MPDPAAGDKKKRPPVKARLTNMHTESVHAVPAGANLRNVALILKADEKGETMAEDGTAAAGDPGKPEKQDPGEELELSTASKDLLLTGITDLVEKLTGLGEAVGAAAINEEAAVPEEVLLVLQGCSDSTAALVQQASPPAPAPAAEPGAEGEPAAEAATAAAELSAKQDAETSGATETEKAGAMLSKKNLGIIRSAVDALAKLLEAAEKEKADDKADKTAKGDDDAPAVAPADDDPAPEPSVADQVTKAIAPLLARFDDQAANVTKAIDAKDAAAAAKDEQLAKMAAQANAPQQPNSAEPEGGGGDAPPRAGVPHNLSDWYATTVAKEAAQQS